MDELDALWAFLVAALVAFAATPPVARLARRLGVIHRPRDRDLHDRPVPGLGGLAILAAVLVSALLFLPAGGETRGIIVGAIAITFVGAVDDWLEGGLHPFVKLAGQFAAAAIPVAAGVFVDHLTLPFLDPIELERHGRPGADAGGHRRRDERRELHRRRRRPRRRACARSPRRPSRSSRSRSTATTRACSRRSPRARPWASSGTTSTRPRSSWATRARTCSACCSPASRSRAC